MELKFVRDVIMTTFTVVREVKFIIQVSSDKKKLGQRHFRQMLLKIYHENMQARGLGTNLEKLTFKLVQW